jgi:hypothetical protein
LISESIKPDIMPVLSSPCKWKWSAEECASSLRNGPQLAETACESEKIMSRKWLLTLVRQECPDSSLISVEMKLDDIAAGRYKGASAVVLVGPDQHPVTLLRPCQHFFGCLYFVGYHISPLYR